MEAIEETIITKKIQSKSVTHRVVSNFVWSVVSEAVGKGVFFAANIYLARVLGVSSFGLFVFAQTITYFFWLAVDLGTSMYGIREIARDKVHAEDIINPLLTLRITAGIIVFSVYLTSLFLLSMPVLNKFTLVGCGVYLLAYSMYADWILKGLEKFKHIAIGGSLSSMAYLLGIMYAVKDSGGLVIAAYIWSFSYFLGSLSLLYFLYSKLGIRYRPSFKIKKWFFHVRESIYFTISGGLMVLYHYLPILMLSVFSTNYEVGIFSAPFRLILAIGAAGFLIPSAFYPVLSELCCTDKKKFKLVNKNLRNIMMLIGFLFAIMVTIFGDTIVGLLFGRQYAESVVIFKILAWIVPLYFVRNSFSIALLAGGFQRQQNLGFISGAVGVTTIGLILIPRNGAFGAVISLLAAEILILITMWIVSVLTLGVKRWTK